MAKTYMVINWNTGKILNRYERLSKAKRECRKLGYTGDGNEAYYSPVAFVGKKFNVPIHGVHDIGVLYNPRFKREAAK